MACGNASFEESVLRYTDMNQGLDEMQDNERKVLLCNLEAYSQHYSAKAAKCHEGHGYETDLTAKINTMREATKNENCSPAHTDSQKRSSGLNSSTFSHINKVESTLLYKTAQRDVLEKLKKKPFFYCRTWQSFGLAISTETSDLFDIV